MFTLYGRATSGNVQKVLFLLEELGAEYERLDYGRTFGNTATPEYLAMNPTQKVPTLADGDLIIWESNTILRYLATKSSSSLYPTNPALRTQVERWMDWCLAALNPVYLGGFKDAKKSANELSPGTVANLEAELSVLDKHLSANTFCAGEDFSLADIALGPIARRCVKFPFEMRAMPNITRWVSALEARKAFMTALQAG